MSAKRLQGKRELMTDSFIKEKSYIQFYRVGVIWRAVLFDRSHLCGIF